MPARDERHVARRQRAWPLTDSRLAECGGGRRYADSAANSIAGTWPHSPSRR
jgi:hypothetical protein